MTADLRDELQRALGSAFIIERELTAGGMSRVFVAEETRFRRQVVIKVLTPELAVGLSADRFEREIMLAASLQDPHIVPVLGGGHVNGLPYYTMPFIDGQSLRARLEPGRVPVATALAILRDVALALEYAHAHGVVHRDIKPDNVLLSNAGRTAMVTDFGIAKAMRASTKSPARPGTITLAGVAVGTPEYMAPEQASGGEIDARADLYSWGVMAYELLTDRHPFPRATSQQEFMAAHVHDAPEPLSAEEFGLPPRLTALVMRCLEKAPDRRPKNASILLAALDSVGDVPTTAPHRPPSARTPQLGMAAVAIVALIASIAVGWQRYGPNARDAALSATVAPRGVRGSHAPISTVAVLPFVNISHDPKDEYFSDGIRDELAHALARLPSLRVAGRSSSYAYKGKETAAQEIGRRLQVAGVVAGTVRRFGDRLRVTAELTGTSDGLVLWSDRYESSAKDVFQVQDEFTRAIVAALAPSLGGPEPATLAQSSRGTMDAEAYDLYLRGHYFWARRGAENLSRATDYFRRAIARDSTFARAYAGLALVNSVASYYFGISGDSAYALTLPPAARALALDASSGEAQLALGTALFHAGRFEEAKKRYRAGLAAEPRNAFGHMWYGDALFATGYKREALEEHEMSTIIDPLSAVLASSRAEALYVAHQFPEAMAVARRGVELDSSYTSALSVYARVFVFGGAPDSAIRHIEANLRGAAPNPTLRAWLVVAYAGAGRWREADSAAQVLRRERKGLPEAARAAVADLARGDSRPFLDMLDGGAREAALVNLGYFGCDPLYDPVRTDRRYLAAAKRHGLYVCEISTRWPIPRRP
jgi:TolB-like protein/tetratricopeptide (TPR) repeat protein